MNRTEKEEKPSKKRSENEKKAVTLDSYPRKEPIITLEDPGEYSLDYQDCQ